MNKGKYFDAGFKPGKYYLCVALIVWTILVLVLAIIFVQLTLKDYLEEANAQARAAIERDISYRAWCSSLGGVYVPITNETHPDPYLKHENRDLTTTDGQRLTLISPAAMTNAVHDKENTPSYMISHLVSDKPLNDINACDPWEALNYKKLYHRETEEVSEIVKIHDQPHIRLIRPLFVSSDCMVCHAQNGYEVGDIRGAICVTLPVQNLLDRKYAIVRKVIVGYIVIWVIGVIGIAIAWRRMLLYDHVQTQTIRTLRRNEAAIRRAKIEAEDANETKTLFLANMSHEIRTPMSAILGFTDLMYNKEMKEEDRDHYIGIIRNNARLLLDMINDLLDMTKIESGKVQLESIPVSPCQVCEDVVTLMRVRALEKNIDIEAVYHFPIPNYIITDLARLRQILINLVGNAVKFTVHGKVTVEVQFQEEKNGTYLLDYIVRDTGIGMTEEEIKRLFEPFTQADASIHRSFGGTGLGLVISQKFANLLGGKIEVSSTTGVGSVFHFEDIDAIGCGQRGEGRIGARKGGSHNPHDKNREHHRSQILHGDKRKDVIGNFGQYNTVLIGKNKQQYAKRKEEQIDGRESKSVGHHVFLRIFQRADGQVFLHHVLIEPRHHNSDKHTTEKLFPEKLLARPVIEHENPRMGTVGNRRNHFSHIHIHPLTDLPQNKDERRNKHCGLYGIGPYNGLDTALVAVQPYNQNNSRNGYGKRNMPCIENQFLKNEGHKVQPRCCSHNLRQKEKPRPRLIRFITVAPVKKTVNRGQIQPIIERQQDIGDNQITGKKTQHHLHIGHVGMPHPARYGDKCNARYGCSHHGKGHQIPWRLLVSAKKSIVVRTFTAGQVRNQHQYAEINGNDNQYKATLHIK